MAGVLTIALDDTELRRALDRAAARLEPGRLMDQVGALMERRINLRFDTKRDPAGVPWPPLAESTRRSYAKADAGRRQGTLLERTGQMRASLGYNVLGDAVEVGFARATDRGGPLALYHEFGTRTRSGGRKMPRRGLLTSDPEAGTLGAGDRDALLALLARYLDGVMD